jgi:DNA-binding MarR family transcriptional regulator
MRVSRLHRLVARVYEQALQTVGLSLPQMEILTVLISATGPVRPAALAGRLMLERSTVLVSAQLTSELSEMIEATRE